MACKREIEFLTTSLEPLLSLMILIKFSDILNVCNGNKLIAASESFVLSKIVFISGQIVHWTFSAMRFSKFAFEEIELKV